jgi:hypothetical protein
MPGSPQWSLSFRFPHQNPIHASLLSHPCNMPRPSHSSRFYHPHNTDMKVYDWHIFYVGFIWSLVLWAVTARWLQYSQCQVPKGAFLCKT